MAVPRKLVVVPQPELATTPATRELWRLAESGETDALAAVLPQADINARNQHGMTALMRAASHGHVHVVRVLLEHGADPNVKRNDNFTALSLAAFFGHAEIVEILMRHGANTDVATRFGTSAQMWAKARSFGDVARCLEKRRDIKKSVSPVSSIPSATPPPLPRAPAVVHTLKDPPEIWDLVQEAPKNFDARSAFMARVGSMKRGFAITVAALLIVVGLVIGGFWFLKGAAPVTVAAEPVIIAEPVVAPPANPAPETTSSEAVEAPVVVNEPVNPPIPTNASRRSRRPATARAVPGESYTQPESAEVPIAPPVVVAPQPGSSAFSAGETKKSAAPVNPQVISQPKSSPPKSKVIQWP